VVVVPGVLETPKEVAGLSVAEAGVSGVVVAILNALTGVDVVPNALPFIGGLGPGLEVSCLGTTNWDMAGKAPLVGFEDGKVTFGSDAPVGLLAVKSKRGREDCGTGWEGAGWIPNVDGTGWLAIPKGDGVG
jgi:hypothetical protein